MASRLITTMGHVARAKLPVAGSAARIRLFRAAAICRGARCRVAEESDQAKTVELHWLYRVIVPLYFLHVSSIIAAQRIWSPSTFPEISERRHDNDRHYNQQLIWQRDERESLFTLRFCG